MLHQPQLSSTVYSGKHGAPLQHLRSTPWILWPGQNAQRPQPAGAGPHQSEPHLGVLELSNPKQAQMVVNKIGGDMGLIKGQDGLVGLIVALRGELSRRNDPVLFVDTFTKITAQVEGAVWAMPQDQFSTYGVNTARLRVDKLSPWRVARFGKLIADMLATCGLMRPHSTVVVSFVQVGFTTYRSRLRRRSGARYW